MSCSEVGGCRGPLAVAQVSPGWPPGLLPGLSVQEWPQPPWALAWAGRFCAHPAASWAPLPGAGPCEQEAVVWPREAPSHPVCAHRTKSQRKGGGGSQPCDSIVVAYYFCGEPIPYRTLVRGRAVTLGQFKELLTKKGSYR